MKNLLIPLLFGILGLIGAYHYDQNSFISYISIEGEKTIVERCYAGRGGSLIWWTLDGEPRDFSCDNKSCGCIKIKKKYFIED
jgi:hypothetical protein